MELGQKGLHMLNKQKNRQSLKGTIETEFEAGYKSGKISKIKKANR
jgi:hypothetical protein